MDEKDVVYLDDLIKFLSEGLGKELFVSDDGNYVIDTDGKEYFKLLD